MCVWYPPQKRTISWNVYAIYVRTTMQLVVVDDGRSFASSLSPLSLSLLSLLSLSLSSLSLLSLLSLLSHIPAIENGGGSLDGSNNNV